MVITDNVDRGLKCNVATNLHYYWYSFTMHQQPITGPSSRNDKKTLTWNTKFSCTTLRLDNNLQMSQLDTLVSHFNSKNKHGLGHHPQTHILHSNRWTPHHQTTCRWRQLTHTQTHLSRGTHHVLRIVWIWGVPRGVVSTAIGPAVHVTNHTHTSWGGHLNETTTVKLKSWISPNNLSTQLPPQMPPPHESSSLA